MTSKYDCNEDLRCVLNSLAQASRYMETYCANAQTFHICNATCPFSNICPRDGKDPLGISKAWLSICRGAERLRENLYNA